MPLTARHDLFNAEHIAIGDGLALVPYPHRHIEDLHQRPPAHSASLRKQPGRAMTITAGQQLLPEDPPELIRKEVALIAAMEQRSGLGPKSIDQVLQIDAPGPLLARAAIAAGQLADPVAAEEHHQSVVMQPHRDLAADQCGRHRVHHLGHPTNSRPSIGRELVGTPCRTSIVLVLRTRTVSSS